MNKQKKRNGNKGITLIALVITIIVMLILTAVVINISIGQSGLIASTKKATQKYKYEMVKEEVLATYAGIKAENIDLEPTAIANKLEEELQKKDNTATVECRYLGKAVFEVKYKEAIIEVEECINKNIQDSIDDWEYDIIFGSDIRLTKCNKQDISTLEIPNTLITEDGRILNVKELNKNVFGNKTEINKLIIASGITTIKSGTFVNCTNIREIIIPSTVNTIESAAFANCNSLEELYIPESVTYIGDSAFYSCKNLKKVTLATSELKGYVFSECSNLKQIVLLEGVKKIGEGAFLLDTALESIIFPNTIKYIECATFDECENLKIVTLKVKPDELKNITLIPGWVEFYRQQGTDENGYVIFTRPN